MTRFTRCLTAAALVLATASCSGGGGAPEVAAVVEGTKVPAAETERLLDTYLGRQRSPGQKPDLPRPQLAKLVVAHQIKLAVLEQLARRHGVAVDGGPDVEIAASAVSPEAFQTIGTSQDEFARELKAGRLSKALAEKLYPAVTVSEEAVRAEYDRRAAEFAPSWKAQARVGRLSSEAAAVRAGQLARAGRTFEEAVAAAGDGEITDVEIDPAASALPPEVVDRLSTMKEGEISDPLGAGAVWLTILLVHRQDVPGRPFEAVAGEIEATLIEAERARLFQDWLAARLAAAEVQVDGHYGEWDPASTSVL